MAIMEQAVELAAAKRHLQLVVGEDEADRIHSAAVRAAPQKDHYHHFIITYLYKSAELHQALKDSLHTGQPYIPPPKKLTAGHGTTFLKL